MDFNALFDNLGGATLDGLTRGSIYALVALGYTLVYGVLRLINFAHSEVFMVGTWTVLGVYTVLGASESSGMGMVDRRDRRRPSWRPRSCRPRWRWPSSGSPTARCARRTRRPSSS